jgi:hypothetical protein
MNRAPLISRKGWIPGFLTLIVLAASPARAQAPPWGQVTIERGPAAFSYTVEEVYFKRPHTYKRDPSQIHKAMVAIKVTVYGQGLREMATGPALWLNRIPANIVTVAPSGDLAEAFFYRPIEDFRKAVRELRGWELVYVPNMGGPGYRIKPRGVAGQRPQDFSAAPQVHLLTDAEWKHAQELAAQFKVEMPPRPPQ